MSGNIISSDNKCEVNYMNSKYIIKSYDCNPQYNLFYKSRSNLMRSMIEKSIANKWTNNKAIVQRVSDIAKNCYESDVKLVIIGTIFKHMKLQPSILKEMSEQNQREPQPILNNYTSENDILWLQDGDEIIKIIGKINASTHVTGVCVALMGTTEKKISMFFVEDVCYATPELQKISYYTLSQSQQYVVIISGLGFSKDMNINSELSNALIMFLNYIRGEISSNYSVKQVTHVIIAGNYIGLKARNQESECIQKKSKPKWDRSFASHTLIATKLFDKFAFSLAQFVSLDIMPGDLDPTTQLLPQQPLHTCLFKKSKHLRSIKCVTNPHCAQYNGRTFLGTSGQNIKSVLQNSKITGEMEAMRRTIEWCHIAPTTPDSLFCYPFVDTDPFVIFEYPDIYFAGNQNEYSIANIEAPNGKMVVMISVPTFETKFSCVLVNLDSLKCDLLFLG